MSLHDDEMQLKRLKLKLAINKHLLKWGKEYSSHLFHALRAGEYNINRLESERNEAEKVFQRARGVSAEAATALKNWPHRQRVAELEKSLAG
jgi:hypothetical protein